MRFTHKKLPKEAAAELIRCPVASVVPYALMVAPAYLYLPRNEKFVSVKAPLDFFTTEEVEKFRANESIYFTKYIDKTEPIRNVARMVLMLLEWVPPPPPPTAKLSDRHLYPEVPLPLSPYELSDAILRLIAPLWGPGLEPGTVESARIEAFTVSLFVQELCGLLPAGDLVSAREKDVEQFERAIHQSSWAVFTALHLGLSNLEYLRKIRLSAFREAVEEKSDLGITPGSDQDEILQFSREFLSEQWMSPEIEAVVLTAMDSRVAQKLSARINRVQQSLLKPDSPVLTVYGEEGFCEL